MNDSIDRINIGHLIELIYEDFTRVEHAFAVVERYNYLIVEVIKGNGYKVGYQYQRNAVNARAVIIDHGPRSEW
jgi:hypothetical protein